MQREFGLMVILLDLDMRAKIIGGWEALYFDKLVGAAEANTYGQKCN